MISIRRAMPEDLRSVLRIETKSFGIDAWSKELFLPYFEQVFLVATQNGAISGYLIAVIRAGRAEIDSIAVIPSQRRKNVGVQLLRRALTILRRRGFEAAHLNVRTDNEPAIRLYRKLGFERSRRVLRYYEDGAPALRMKLTLPPLPRKVPAPVS